MTASLEYGDSLWISKESISGLVNYMQLVGSCFQRVAHEPCPERGGAMASAHRRRPHSGRTSGCNFAILRLATCVGTTLGSVHVTIFQQTLCLNWGLVCAVLYQNFYII